MSPRMWARALQAAHYMRFAGTWWWPFVRLHITVTGVEHFQITARSGWKVETQSETAPDPKKDSDGAADRETNSYRTRTPGIAGDLIPVRDLHLPLVIDPLSDADPGKPSRDQGAIWPVSSDIGQQGRAADTSEAVPPVQILADSRNVHAGFISRHLPTVKAQGKP